MKKVKQLIGVSFLFWEVNGFDDQERGAGDGLEVMRGSEGVLFRLKEEGQS